MATGTSIDQKSASKDPLASCNIPQIIEDRRLDVDVKAVHYKRGSLLGKVIVIRFESNDCHYIVDYMLIGWICEGICRHAVAGKHTICIENSG